MTAMTGRAKQPPSPANLESWAQGEAIPQLTNEQWLQLAQQSPSRLLWVVEPSQLFPLKSHKQKEALWTALKPALIRENLDLALNWLRIPEMGSDEAVTSLIEARLKVEAGECSWLLLADALEVLALRGGRWQAARQLEQQLEGAGLDDEETARITLAARELMDAPLLATLARHPAWKNDERALLSLVEASATDSLVDNFGCLTPPARLRLSVEEAGQLQALVWRNLASRKEPAALRAVEALLTALANEPTTEVLATAMTGILQQTHGKSAIQSLVRVFLAGTQYSPAGEVIERWLMEFPLDSLEAALDPFPEVSTRFDPQALRRLCFRMLPLLTEPQRAEIGELARLGGAARSEVVCEELELL
tara:strand:+ start:241 stop:1332 length:1092 start_codon:yes stop_codon:yes gene_type:complete